MPPRLSNNTFKVVNGRSVPSLRFNLKPGAPSHILHSAQPATLAMQELRPNLQVVAHPLLWSVPLAPSVEEEALPVQKRQATGPLFADRHDEVVSWYLPTFHSVRPSDAHPALSVRDIGLDREGEPTYGGVLTFRFEQAMPEDAARALERVRAATLKVKARAILVALKEAVLTLRYTEDGEEQQLTFTAPYDADANEARFELRAPALKLAYALLAERGGVDLKLVGDYNAWVPSKERPSAAIFRTQPVQARPMLKTLRAPKPRTVMHVRAEPAVAPAGTRTALALRGIGKKEVTRGERIVNQNGEAAPAEDVPVEPSYIKQRQIFQQSTRPSFPCHRFGNAYRLAHPEGERALGCQPPWSDGFASGARYRALGPSEVNLDDDLQSKVTLFESLNEVAAFLLVPASYVVTRTSDTFAPTVSMTSVLDPEDAEESTVVFDFVVTPDLPDFDTARVREALSAYLAKSLGVRRVPVLQFPTALPTPPALEWSDPFTTPSAPTADGDAYALTAAAHSVGKAAAVVKRLMDRTLGLRGTFEFTLDETQTESASLLVSLGRTTGPALVRERAAEDKAVVLTNATESALVLRRLLLQHEADGPLDLHALEQPRVLQSGEAYTLTVPPPLPERIFADYEVREDTSRSLTELRVDVSILELLLTIDTDLQPHEAFIIGTRSLRVDHVSVALRLGEEGADSVTISAGEQHFGNEVVSLLIPLDRYLHPEQRTVSYQATFHLKDEAGVRDERATGWLEHNYGNSANVTMRRQQLQELLPETF